MHDLSQVLNQAIDFHRKGNLAAAEGLYLQLLNVQADHFDGLQMLGILRYQQGRLIEALSLLGAALQTRSNFAPAHLNYGLVLDALGRHEEALVSFDRALSVKPDYVDAYNNRGYALQDLKRPGEALASYDKALAIQPSHAKALFNRGSVLLDLHRPADALESYDRALAVKPDYVEALNNRGLVLLDLHRPAEALASFDRALAIRPDYARALNNRGNILQDLKRPAEALASYEKLLAVRPDYVEALYNRGVVLRDLHRPAEALASFDRALSIAPDHVDALNNRGIVLRDMNRPVEALASYDRVLTIKPDYADALNNRGLVLRDLRRPAEALVSFDKALTSDPDHRYALGAMADAALASCDWARTAMLAGDLEARIAQPGSIISPFTLLGYTSDPSTQLECAKRAIRDKMPVPAQALWTGAIRHHDRIWIAYLSADFRGHPVAVLVAELFELHDRARFEVLGISFGPDDQSDMRARLVRAFDQFHDVRSMSDLDAAKLLNDLQADIAVDLTGHTQDSRLGILAHRPAPIQVSYLGYPGTMGADFIDYVIADKTVLPFDQQPFYTERIVHLPDCYQVNDSKREIAAHTPTRHEAGLPDEGFVFCCFNNNYKITPPVFDVWMRLLGAVEGSVLWLLHDNGDAQENLRKEAAARGIDPARLVFAGRLTLEEHLARHRLADLFVDTLPYNAHTTASDALWAGLPLLTCRGSAFAGRVATSLLHAAGLPDLATSDLGEYEALALRLATDPSILRGFRHRLAQNRATCPLFDTDRFCRHIESAYTTMWELQQRGESPQSFSVKP